MKTLKSFLPLVVFGIVTYGGATLLSWLLPDQNPAQLGQLAGFAGVAAMLEMED